MPVSGSSYTYAYATLGEVFAWVMGWLIVLEYGVAGATVAVGFSGYFNSLMGDFGVHIPAMLTTPLIYVADRSEEHTSELQSLMRISYAVFCLKKKIIHKQQNNT